MAYTEGMGAAHVREGYGVEPSELGAITADLLDELFRGLYHIERDALRVDWTDTHHITLTWYGSLATFDFDLMTRLVFLCHDYCVRGEVSAATPNRLRLMFHRRQREGAIYKRHPTLEQAVATWRERHSDLLTDEVTP